MRGHVTGDRAPAAVAREGAVIGRRARLLVAVPAVCVAGACSATGPWRPSGTAATTEPPAAAIHQETARDEAPTDAPAADADRGERTAARAGDGTNEPLVLSLEEIINRALTANRTVLTAQDRVESAGLTIVQAESQFELKFFPTGSVGASGEIDGDLETVEQYGAGLEARKEFTYGTIVSVEPSFERFGDTFETGVETRLTQPLLRGLNQEFNLSRVHAAEFGDRAARRSEYLTRVNTVLGVVTAAYNVVRQREFVRLNTESAERLRGHYEAAKVKEGIGITTAIDTYRAGLELKQAEDNLTNAVQAYEDALDALRVLLALDLGRELEVDAPLSYDRVTMPGQEAVKVALRTRVELDQAADAVRDFERQARITEHNILPDLDLELSFARVGLGDDFGDSTDINENFYGVNLTTTTDLARTAERAAAEQARINVRTGRRALSLERDRVVQEVKFERRNLDRATQRIAIQQAQIEQAEGQLALARVKFERGLADNFDVIDAEAELRQAQLNLIGVVTDYIVGTYRFRASLGTLLERPARF